MNAVCQTSGMPETHTDRALPWHILTCEYPPQTGGVSDYTFLVANGLASHDEVHVWCPSVGETRLTSPA